MDPILNPYAPGAGTRPPELAGREKIISVAEIALKRVSAGRPERSMIMVGLRGVGKTVLLNEINHIAEEAGFFSVFVEAHEGKGLPELLTPFLRSALYRLSRIESAKEISKRGLRVLRSFFNNVKIKFSDLEVGLSMEPETGVADSGDLETDLPDLFLVIAQAAKAANKPILIIIDELQYLTSKEFSALTMSIHKINQRNLPLILIGAGLPQILGLAGNSKSYAERLFRYPEIGVLTNADATEAIVAPALEYGVEFTPEAISALLKVTHRYPYFIQQWAYESWNYAEGKLVEQSDVLGATPKAISELDQSFFKVRFDRCTPAERRYMRALAEFGEGSHRSGAIAEVLGVKAQTVAPTRYSLIKKGMIFSPSHGYTTFTVPMFYDYMHRAMPALEQIPSAGDR